MKVKKDSLQRNMVIVKRWRDVISHDLCSSFTRKGIRYL